MEPLVTVLRSRLAGGWLADPVVAGRARMAYVAERSFGRWSPDRAGVLVDEDPARFLGRWIAALEVGAVVQLASPRWGAAEMAEARRLAALPRSDRWPAGPLTAVPTGGTGGRLRFAVHTPGSLEAAVGGLSAVLGGGPLSATCTLPLHHVSGLMQVVRTAVTGGVLEIAHPDVTGRALLPEPPDGRTLISLVPTQLARFLARPGGPEWLRRHRAVLLGGAAAAPDLLGRAREAGVPVAPVYGMSETAAMVTLMTPEAFAAGRGGVGRVLPHAVLSTGDGGRIRVGGRSVCFGYWPEPFEGPREVDTGDSGSIDAEGWVTIHGRVDDAILTGGEKVWPGEVEAALVDAGCAAAALVVGVPDPEWGSVVAAVVVPAAEGVDVLRLSASLAGRVARHKVPRRWVTVRELPLTPLGKPDRRAAAALVARTA